MKPASAFVLAAIALGLLATSVLLCPSPVSAQEACLEGMERSVDTYGQCCWPGQGWNGTRCVGPPRACPSGFEVTVDGCEERFVECPAGQVMMTDQAHCCWPGQDWSGGRCSGTPTSCPGGYVAVDESCVESPSCSGGQELTIDRLHCCWPGQSWDEGWCEGTPTSCPAAHVAALESCLPVPVCGQGEELTFDELHCCWPGQAWAPSQERCIGVPERCPAPLLVDGQDCLPPPVVEAPAGTLGMDVSEDCPAGTNREGQDCVEGRPTVEVSAGPFWMGCSSSDSGCYQDERPGREVTLAAFVIEVTEVTVAEYGACVDAGVCAEPPAGNDTSNWGKSGRESHPVNDATWDDAVTYCGWVGRRLPTEAEWEKAARGTDGRVYPWGNEAADCSRAVMVDRAGGCGTGTTAPVGSKPSGASPYGALDMAGNVWEWTADWFGKRSHRSEPSSNPDGPDSGSERVVRGGSFDSVARDVRAGGRYHYPPSYRHGHFGFRCVM